MTTKELKRTARRKIQEGNNRQQVFDEMSEETNVPPEKLITALDYLPSMETVKKYRVPRIILLISMVALIFLYLPKCIEAVQTNGITGATSFLLPIGYAVSLAGILASRFVFFKWAALLSLLLIIDRVLVEHFVTTIKVITDLSIAGLICILGIYLHSKMKVRFNMKTEEVKTSDGKLMLKQRYVFFN